MKQIFTIISLFFSLQGIAQNWLQLNDSLIKYFNKEEFGTAAIFGEKGLLQSKEEYGLHHPNYLIALENLRNSYNRNNELAKASTLAVLVLNYYKQTADTFSVEYAAALNQLAILQEKTKQFILAEENYLKILMLLQLKEKPNQLKIDVLGNLANLYVEQNKKIEALKLYEERIEYYKTIFGEEEFGYATSLNNLAVLYESMGNYSNSELLYVQAMQLRKKVLGEYHPEYATSLNNLAYLYVKLGNYERAESLYIQALEIWKKVFGEVHPDYANCLNNLAYLYNRTGNYLEAEHLYMQVLELFKKVFGETHLQYAACLNNLGVLYNSTGNYKKAELFYLRALVIRKNELGESHPDYATSLINLAQLNQIMGIYPKAILLNIQALEIYKKVLGEVHPDYATGMNNLAVLYDKLGDYAKAEPLYVQAMEIWKRVLGKDHSDYATSVFNMAYLYEKIGNYNKAELYYLQAMEIRKKVLGEGHPDYAASLNNLAVLYNNMGNYTKAESLYVEAIAIRKKVFGEQNPDYATSLNNLAYLYTLSGNYLKAEPLYIQAIEILEKVLGKTHPDYATSLNNLANLYESMGNYTKAELVNIQAMEIRKKVLGESHPDYAISLNNLANLYEKTGNYAQSVPKLLQGMDISRKQILSNISNLSEKEKETWFNKKLYENEILLSFQYNYKAFSDTGRRFILNQQLILKSLILTDTKNLLQTIQNNNDSSLQKTYFDWIGIKKYLSQQYSLPIARRNTELSNWEIQAEVLEKQLNRQSNAFRQQQQVFHINSVNVQKALGEEEVAIEFVRFNLYNKKWTDSTMYAAYILTKTDSVAIFVPLCEEKQLQKLFDSAGTTATSMVSKFYRGLEIKNKNAAGALGTELYKLIWQPLEQYLKGVKKVSYSPAGKLYSIAFHALPVDSATVLMDKYQLQQYTSTRQVVLREQQKQIIKPQSITLFGDASFTLDSLELTKQKMYQPDKENISTSIYTPKKRSSENNSWSNLPGTAQEVKTIQKIFEQNKVTTKSFTQTTASEENLKALTGNSPQILHIATHGFFLPEPAKKGKENNFNKENTYTLADDPLLRSGLVLAGGNYAWSGKTPIEGVEDGIATAYEISQLNLSNTELVVLSACETALGDVKGSEGVFGLQRAFKMAGVKKMIVSLWQVPDKETAELMTSFYSYWMKGKKINDAFAQAQADMRKKYSPFYWAAFVLVE